MANMRDEAVKHSSLRRIEVKRALDAGRLPRCDDPRVALKSLRAAVDDRPHRRRDDLAVLVVLEEGVNHRVDPPSRYDRVEAADDDVEAAVKFLVFVLDGGSPVAFFDLVQDWGQI